MGGSSRFTDAIRDLCEACYKAGFRDGVVFTLLTVLILVFILWWWRGQRQ